MPHEHTSATGPEDIYRKLESGLGHELVDDGNVDSLIQIAVRKGNSTIEAILREWRANCEAPYEDPSTDASTGRSPHLNSAHAKH